MYTLYTRVDRFYTFLESQVWLKIIMSLVKKKIVRKFYDNRSMHISFENCNYMRQIVTFLRMLEILNFLAIKLGYLLIYEKETSE